MTLSPPTKVIDLPNTLLSRGGRLRALSAEPILAAFGGVGAITEFGIGASRAFGRHELGMVDPLRVELDAVPTGGFDHQIAARCWCLTFFASTPSRRARRWDRARGRSAMGRGEFFIQFVSPLAVAAIRPARHRGATMFFLAGSDFS